MNRKHVTRHGEVWAAYLDQGLVRAFNIRAVVDVHEIPAFLHGKVLQGYLGRRRGVLGDKLPLAVSIVGVIVFP